jgi:alpha-ketoglutarate-dependent taurine dioxygenase
MSILKPNPFKLEQLRKVKRKPIGAAAETLVKVSLLQPGANLPLVVQPATDGIELVDWARRSHEFIESRLSEHGGLLLRNFKVDGIDKFEQFVKALSDNLLDYSYRSTPRTQVSGHIYTSTEYPADHSIRLHNEMSYSKGWPMKIFFHCIKAADRGGETPIADSRRVFQRIPPRIRDKFEQKQIMYVRNYRPDLDLSWQTVFQTNSKVHVEEYCRRAGIKFAWKGPDHLMTSQICQAVAKHPKTGETVWFNQAHLFHISNLEQSVREVLLTEFKEEDLPRNAYYGDGSPIESSALAEICEAYKLEARVFPWKEGDIVVLDNMLAAHGREPFEGTRRVVVAMSDIYSE